MRIWEGKREGKGGEELRGYPIGDGDRGWEEGERSTPKGLPLFGGGGMKAGAFAIAVN